jgi:type IV secretion system protein VirB1
VLLTMLLFSQLVSRCAPSNAVQTLASVAKVESGFDTLAIHDNTTSETPKVLNGNDAVRLASGLIARGHSVDVGLMQINSNNLRWLGLSVTDAFDACKSVAAGASVLRNGYQQALRVAFSRYNTGDAERGFANGYVRRVLAASNALPPITAQAAPPPSPSPAQPPQPVVVLDMLHGATADASAPAQNNLLASVVVSRAQPDPSPSPGPSRESLALN